METNQAQKPEYIEHQENNNCQQFYGPISGCVFAMPGSTVNMQAPSTNQEKSTQSQIENKIDAAIKAVFEANICESPDWVAVVRLFQERGLKQLNGLPYDADYINSVCGQTVTSQSSISRAVMNDKIGGRYPNWIIRSGTESREMPKILALYNQIADIAVGILDK